MAIFADRVKETSTTTGTGTFTLAGTSTGFVAFSVVGNGATVYYCITDSFGNWEVGSGTYTLSGTTLTRSVLSSSNANALVNFPAGTKEVFLVVPASFVTTTQTLTDAVTVSSSNIGLGTTPSVRLHVSAGTNANEGQFKITTTGTFGGFSIWTGSSNADARNWQQQTNYQTFGTYDFMRSTTNTGNPTTVAMSFNKDGNIAFGTPNSPTGGGTPALALAQASGNPTGIASNTAGLIAKDNGGTCELYSWDEAGNVTLISPHAMDGPEWLYDPDDELPRVLKEENVYLGVTRWTNETRKNRLLQMLISGEDLSQLTARQRQFVHTEYGEKRDWEADQTALRNRSEEQLSAWQKLPKEEREKVEQPKPHVSKPVPEFIRKANAARN